MADVFGVPYFQTNQEMEFWNSIKLRPDLAKFESLRGIFLLVLSRE